MLSERREEKEGSPPPFFPSEEVKMTNLNLFMKLDRLHEYPVDRRGHEQLVRIAKAYYLFIYLSPEAEEISREYYMSLLESDLPLGQSIRQALEKRDKYFSALEVIARYLIYGNPDLERIFTQEQEETAQEKALRGYKKLLELLLPEEE